uniref:C2H2-type domain-containing protein n=2 Tax=unclassified bacterial viruses TaxID=12333 RepID=A0AAU7J804_9VIRU
MSPRFYPSDEGERPRVLPGSTSPGKVTLQCPEEGCDWVGRTQVRLVHASLTGHYSHAHPERRPPDRRDARRAAGL